MTPSLARVTVASLDLDPLAPGGHALMETLRSL